MILSLASAMPGTSSAAWLLGLPSGLAALAYLAAALLSQRPDDGTRGGSGNSSGNGTRDGSGVSSGNGSGNGLGNGLRWALLAGWIAQAAAIVVDIAGLGSDSVAARFGFAPALSLTVWMVIGVYVVESSFVPLPGPRRVLAALGVAVVVLAWLFPGEVRPQAPSRWAPLHWVLGIASYGLFGAGVLHAALLNRAERQMRRSPRVITADLKGMPLMRLERLTFRFVAVGFAVLSATIVGAWVAVPWRWDYKTLFSILGWIVFAALLAGRRSFGWRGPAATRWVYAGAALLLLAYVGSRFVFEVLLHRPPPA